MPTSTTRLGRADGPAFVHDADVEVPKRVDEPVRTRAVRHVEGWEPMRPGGPNEDLDESMAEADGEGRSDESSANDTEERYGSNESPA